MYWITEEGIFHTSMEYVKKVYIEILLKRAFTYESTICYVLKECRADNSIFFHVYTSNVPLKEKVDIMAFEAAIKAWDSLFDFYFSTKYGEYSEDFDVYHPFIHSDLIFTLEKAVSKNFIPAKLIIKSYENLIKIVKAEEKLAKMSKWPGTEIMYEHYREITTVTRLVLEELGLPKIYWKRTALLFLFNNIFQLGRAGVYNRILSTAPLQEVEKLSRKLLVHSEDLFVLEQILEKARSKLKFVKNIITEK